MARPWYSYNVDPLGEARPTQTRFRLARNRRRNIYGNFPTMAEAMRREPYEVPYTSPWEVLEDLRQRFEAQPVTYKTDPLTGKVIASKTMAKPEMPSEMRGMRRFHKLFGEGELTSKWILPKGAMGGQRFIQRQPTSDIQRQMGYRFGVSNVGPSIATVDPSTYWPGSAFKVPMREPSGTYGQPEPVFGGTIDYTTGRRITPPTGRFGYSDPYGTFDPRFKTVPSIRRFVPQPTMLGKVKSREQREWDKRFAAFKRRKLEEQMAEYGV